MKLALQKTEKKQLEERIKGLKGKSTITNKEISDKLDYIIMLLEKIPGHK